MNNNTELSKMKVCSKCKVKKGNDNFGKRKTSKDGFDYHCKECRSKQRLRDKEKYNEYRKEYRRKSKERLKEYYRSRNKDPYEHQKNWRRRNRGREKERMREYRQSDAFKKYMRSDLYKERNRIQQQKRRAQKKNLDNALTLKQWEACKKCFDYKCCYCGKDEKMTQEHFIPFCNGGEFTQNNILPCCFTCNVTKRNKDFFEWYPTFEHYSRTREQRILNYLNYNQNKIQQLSLL